LYRRRHRDEARWINGCGELFGCRAGVLTTKVEEVGQTRVLGPQPFKLAAQLGDLTVRHRVNAIRGGDRRTVPTADCH